MMEFAGLIAAFIGTWAWIAWLTFKFGSMEEQLKNIHTDISLIDHKLSAIIELLEIVKRTIR